MLRFMTSRWLFPNNSLIQLEFIPDQFARDVSYINLIEGLCDEIGSLNLALKSPRQY